LWYQYGVQLTCVLDTQVAYEQIQLNRILKEGSYKNDRLTSALAKLDGCLSKIADIQENDFDREASKDLISKLFVDFRKDKHFVNTATRMIVDKARLNRSYGRGKMVTPSSREKSPQSAYASLCSQIKNLETDRLEFGEEFAGHLVTYVESTTRKLTDFDITSLELLKTSSPILERTAQQSLSFHVAISDARFVTYLLIEGILSKKKFLKMVDGLIGDLQHQHHRIVAILETFNTCINGIETLGLSNFEKVKKKIIDRLEHLDEESQNQMNEILTSLSEEKRSPTIDASPTKPVRWSTEGESSITDLHLPPSPMSKQQHSPLGENSQQESTPSPFSLLFAPVSYVVLLSELCDVDYKSKYETRSEQRSAEDYWTRRPLSEPMLLSASLDAFFLLPLYEVLRLLLAKSETTRDKIIELLQRSQLYVETFRDHAQEDNEEDRTTPFVFSDWNIIPSLSSGNTERDLICRVIRIEDGTIARVIGRKGSSITELRTHVLDVTMFTCSSARTKMFIIGTKAAVTRTTLLIPKRSSIVISRGLADKFDYSSLQRINKKTRCKVVVNHDYKQGPFFEIILFGDDTATQKAFELINKLSSN
jgi:hypothetical protein